MQAEYDTYFAALEESPRVVQAQEAYYGCLADAGYPGVDSTHPIHDAFYTEFEQTFPDRENITDQDALRAFQERERAAALVEAACAAPVRRAHDPEQVEPEQDIIKRVGPQLAAWEAT